MPDTLDSHGVDTGALRVDPRPPTPLTGGVLAQGDDRAVVTAPGTLVATTAADVPDGLLAAARDVHAASYFLLRTARAHGATTSLDTNDGPSGRWDPPGPDAVLAHTDCHDGHALLTTPGIPARPVDTVGAGDSFDAGFVAAVLAGLALAEALELAAVCGALSTRAHGGTAAQPTWDEAFAQVTRNGKNPA